MGRRRGRRQDNGAGGSGSYWILIDDSLRVDRRQRMSSGPALGSGLGMWWISVSKSVWGKYRAGDVVKVEDVPVVTLDRIREARRVRGNRETETRVFA